MSAQIYIMVKIVKTELKLREVERKFKTSCRQVSILDRQMDSLQVRYKRAYESKRPSLYNSFRMRLATLEGVRQAFYLYAMEKATEKHLLKEEMRQELMRTTEE